jgi:hypothetical protein
MKTLHTNYKVDSGDITLTVVVGNGQRGNTLVAIGSAVLANGPNISNLRIGKGSDLNGKTLSVISTVSQVNTSTQDAVITYELRGGAEDRDSQLDDDFADGQVQIQFVATFDLTE